jgi:hypothetical protein
MNHILKDLLDNCIVVYIGEILIYAKNEEKHYELVKEILERLGKLVLVILPEKCNWSITEMEYLGYIITRAGMKMAKDETLFIQEWQTPQ